MSFPHGKISKLQLFLITVTVMSATVIEILDITIVNVSLAPMMGELGANSDQITWVMTSYIVSSAIVMPLTGFLVTRFGERDLLLISISGFLVSSLLCGSSMSLTQIVFFRTLQGIFGAPLVPLSQSILRTTFPQDQIGQAMIIWGVGIMVAPVFGPLLGGIITYHLNWRWVFFVNLPVCIFAFFMTLNFITQTPTEKKKIDWTGLILLVLAIGAFQLFLDRGNSADWFESRTILLFLLMSLVSLTVFIIRGLRIENSILNLRLFKDMNLTLCSIIVAFISANTMALMAMQPLLLQNYFGYPSQTVGILLAPRGIASAVTMILLNPILKKIDGRILMILGVIIISLSSITMSHFNLETPFTDWLYTGVLQGIGTGLLMVPAMTLAYETVPFRSIPEASGIFNLLRSLGGSIGISILITLVTREMQVNWNQLSIHINTFNPNLNEWLTKTGMSLSDPKTLPILANQVHQQAAMLAFLDGFYAISISVLGLLLLIPFLKKRYGR